MKRMMSIVLAVCLLFSFTACHFKEKTYDKYIQKVDLNEQEEDILNLLGVDNEYAIYDFQVDKQIKRIQVNIYELKDGTWNRLFGNDGKSFEDEKGRIALSTENIAEQCRIAIQSDSGSSANSYKTGKDQEDMGRATSYLSEKKEIVYGQEIPLIIQIHTAKNSVHCYDVEYFNEPEEYSELNYEHVYAVTVRFYDEMAEEK